MTDIFNQIITATDRPNTSHFESEKLHIHRTKCAAIIKEVIAPVLLSELIEDIGNSPFSLIIDESTDVSTEKLLCLCVKYYSHKKNSIFTQFVSFVSVVQTTAEDLYDAIVNILNSVGLNSKNIIGIGTDGAANLCGQHKSAYTLLKKNLGLDNLVLVKCICHSIHLCGSKASEVFADKVDFLVKETYNWFKNSTLRLSRYKSVYDLININTDNVNGFTKLTALSATRWLSRYRAVDKILNQYLELETFFSIQAQTEKCYTAQLLSKTYQDKKHKIILIFLLPHLKELYFLNLYFQKTDVDFYKAFDDINNKIWSLARQILKPSLINHLNGDLQTLENSLKYPQNMLNYNDCDLGYSFENELAANTNNIISEEVTEIKGKCVEFIKVLLLELIKRMPSHLNVFRQIRSFSPAIILNPVQRPKFTDLPLTFISSDKLTDIEIQYRNLLNVDWKEVFGESVPENPIIFWKKVRNIKNAGDELMFKDLALFAFTLLSLPSSNAFVERVFSLMNIVKCKIRNKMMLKMLNSVVSIRSHFATNEICCKDFEPSKAMYVKFNSDMYQQKKQSTATSNNTDDDDVLIFCEQFV